VLGAIGVFVIEKKFVEASVFALSGAVLTFFGFMHDESAGLAATPAVAIAYTIIAVFLFGLSRRRCSPSLPERRQIDSATRTGLALCRRGAIDADRLLRRVPSR
jgi:adenine/guanine/hypoxanthine permease